MQIEDIGNVDYISFDGDVQALEVLGETASDIAKQIINRHNDQDIENENEEEDEDDEDIIAVSEPQPKKMAKIDVDNALKTLKNYALGENPQLLTKVFDMESAIAAYHTDKMLCSHQTTVTDFFHKM